MDYIQLHESFPSADNTPTMDAFHSAFDVVFVDPSGFFNILGSMTRTSYQALKHEARLALNLLDDSLAEGFSSLFIEKSDVRLKYDATVHVHLTSTTVRRYQAQLLDRAGDWPAFGTALVAAVLARG